MEKLEKLKMVNFGFNGIITADKASFDYIIRVFPTAFNNQRYMRDVKYYGDRPKNLFKDNAQIFVEKQEIKVKAYQVFDLVPAATTFEYWLYDIAELTYIPVTIKDNEYSFNYYRNNRKQLPSLKITFESSNTNYRR